MTTAFIEAKDVLLRASIEKRMSEYEKLIDDLESQKAQLERERGLRVTEKDLLAFIAELLKGNPADNEYRRQIIDNFVYKGFIGNGDDAENVRLYEVIANIFGVGVQTQLPSARQ